MVMGENNSAFWRAELSADVWAGMVGIGSCQWGEEVREMVVVALMEGTSFEGLVELLAIEKDFFGAIFL